MNWFKNIRDWTKRNFQQIVDKTIDVKDSIIKRATKSLGLEQKFTGTFMFDSKKVFKSPILFYEIVSLKHKREEDFVRILAYNDKLIQDQLLILGHIKTEDIDRVVPIKLVFTDRQYNFVIEKIKGSWLFKVDNSYLDMEFSKKTLWPNKYSSQNESIDIKEIAS